MKIEKRIKETFVVIGKEGSTMDGQGFIQKLWENANSHYSEVQSLAKKDENGKFIRRERFCGNCSRSFYVGEHVEQTDIKAKFEDGILKVYVPKKEAKPVVEEKKYITIEG